MPARPDLPSVVDKAEDSGQHRTAEDREELRVVEDAPGEGLEELGLRLGPQRDGTDSHEGDRHGQAASTGDGAIVDATSRVRLVDGA